MTTGAAQTLWRSYRTLPGRRVLVSGNGPLNLQVALELKRGGADVVAVAELAPAPWRAAAIGAALGMLRAAPKLTLQGLAYVRALRRHGVPSLHDRVIASVEADGGALRARLRRVDGGAVGEAAESFVVDAVCVGYGFQPQNDVLRALGARHDFDPARGHLIARRDGDGATTIENVWAAGDCCGLGGALAAADEGILAGVAAARSLGRAIPPALEREAAAARRRLPNHRRFQRALWRLFAGPRLTIELAAEGTFVCRCESVTLATVAAALADGARSIGEVKRATRLGMGRCQGRYCAPVLASVLAARDGATPDEMSLFAPRAPIKPVTIAELLATAGR